MNDTDLDAAVTAVTELVADRHVVISTPTVRPDARIWVRGVDVPVDNTVLRAAAKAGLLAESKRGSTYWWFTTPAKKAEADAEAALSDGERAERCVPRVRELYERNRAQYGDDVANWAVDGNLNAIPQDGIGPAVAAGLLVTRRVPGLGSRLVPAEHADAYDDAMAAATHANEVAQAKHDALAAELATHTGPSRRGERHVSISTSQIERLLAAITKEPECPTR